MMNEFYFKINLNKFGELKVQAEREKKTFRTAVVCFILGMALLISAWVYINNQVRLRVENRQRYLAETKKQLESFQTSADYLSSGDLDNLASTFNNRIFWARKMIALGNEIDNKLAVRKFSYANGILTLNGIT